MQTVGTECVNVEQIFREAAIRVIGNAIHATSGSKTEARYAYYV